MLKKAILVLFFCLPVILAVFYGNQFRNRNSAVSLEKNTQKDIKKSNLPPIHEQTSIFVPYWEIPDAPINDKYDTLYYFGISNTSNGVNKFDEGYQNLETFVTNTKSPNSYLTLRMLNTDQNLAILKNKTAQQNIIKETLETAKENGFKGVVLDLELSALSFTNIVERVTSFSGDFYTAAHSEKLEFMQTVYGDVFYRQRPYDVKTLAQNSDGLIIMAYDFHKVGGLPGPNFPFSGRDKYGYDFQEMVTDFLKVTTPEKLTVVFGMYGYDWITNLKGVPTQSAKAISLNEIKEKYLGCTWENCVKRVDEKSKEAEISFVDSGSSYYPIYHQVRYENEDSVAIKRQYLFENRVGKIGYWTYGYF